MFRRCRKRRGLSLAELLMATAILMLVAGAIGALAVTVETTNQHGQGYATATQHARIALERIERALREAHASPEFPGFASIGADANNSTFPDTLVIWRPESGIPASPMGRPLFGELVVYRVHPTKPNVLLEVTAPDDVRTTPALTDTSAWLSELSNMQLQSSYQEVVLTDLLRTASPGGNSSQRGAVRFEVVQTPSDDELADFRDGLVAWKDLPWVQGLRGTSTGLRQSHCRIELQLMPGRESATIDSKGLTAAPYFGSSSLLFEVLP